MTYCTSVYHCSHIIYLSIHVPQSAFRGPVMTEINLGHSSLIHVLTNTHIPTDVHIVMTLQKVVPYAHIHVQTHAKYLQNIIQMCPIEIHCTYIHTPANTHCVTVVCFIHRVCEELNYWGTNGRTWKRGSSRTGPFICSPVHPHSPRHSPGEMPVTLSCPACQRHPFPSAALGRPYRHDPMVHSVCRS